MKLLHVTADWKWTGPAEPMLHAVTGLRERGLEVDLACPAAPPESDGALQARARERGVEPVHALAAGQGYLPLRDGPEVRRLRRLLEAGRYDLVHAHHTRDHLLARLAARPLRIPVVVSWHRGEPIPATPWSRLLLGPRGCAGVTTLSERLAEAARARLRGPAGRIGVVPGAVDARFFAPRCRSEALRGELGLEPAQRVLGVVARLQPHRRFELLLEGFRRALDRAPSLRLLVVGRGTRARQVLEQPAERLGLKGAVVPAGYRRGDFRDVLALLDALVFLVPGSDGSCRAVLEAMAMEVPTVASRRGILPETVADGETGRLVDERPDALADAFVDLWRHPAEWQARGKRARDRVLERHTVELQAERLERFYGDVLSGAS